MPGFNVKPGLRTVFRIHILDWDCRSAGKISPLRDTTEFGPRLKNFASFSLVLELQRNRFGVAVLHRDAITLRAHLERSRKNPRAIQRAEKFVRLLFHLLFFV